MARKPQSTAAQIPLGAVLLLLLCAAGEIVPMEPYTVRERASMGAMHADIQREQTSAAKDSRMAKLGVGIRDVKVAGVHLFLGTVFYIPFVVGFGDPLVAGAATAARRPGAP